VAKIPSSGATTTTVRVNSIERGQVKKGRLASDWYCLACC
jgi:hypothetical protein